MKHSKEFYHRGIKVTKGNRVFRGGIYGWNWHFELNGEKYTELSSNNAIKKLDYLMGEKWKRNN